MIQNLPDGRQTGDIIEENVIGELKVKMDISLTTILGL